MGKANDYTHTGGFDSTRFADAFRARKKDHAYFKERFNEHAVANAWTLVEMMQADQRVIDLRWMAYMLATAFWEASQTVPETVERPKLGKGNKPVLDENKKPVMIEKTIYTWRAMTPIDELSPSASKLYKAPVKIRKIDIPDLATLRAMSKVLDKPDLVGGAWIVEKDGDQFVVDASGTSIWTSKKAGVGAPFTGKASKTYTAFHGDPYAYFGRGYVQLTWWNSYVSAGVDMQRGLDLLFDPTLVKNPQIAYAVMANGMVNGTGFANGRKLANYIHGDIKDYSNARKMVNYNDKKSYQPIAEIAQLFEDMLLESKLPAADAPPAATVPGAVAVPTPR